MSLLTFDNPVFRYYALAAALMVVKMMSQGWITVFRMLKVNGGFRYPEDAQQSLANPRPGPEQLQLNEYVERSRRMHGCFTSVRGQAIPWPWDCSRLTRSRVSPIFMSCLRPDHTNFVLCFGALAR